MADVEAVRRDRPIDAGEIPAGKCMIQAVWRDEAGSLYVKQAVGDARVLCLDMGIRSNLMWSFIAAWISMMAATFNIEICEIEEDPLKARRAAEESRIVGLDGKAYNVPHGKTDPEPN